MEPTKRRDAVPLAHSEPPTKKGGRSASGHPHEREERGRTKGARGKEQRRRPGACPRHPGEPALLRCDLCHIPGCPDCIRKRWGRLVCPSCFERRSSIRLRAALFATALFLILGGVGWMALMTLSKKPKQKSEIEVIVAQLKRDPENEVLMSRLTKLYTVKQQFKRASYYMKKLLERNPTSKRLLLRMVLLQYNAKAYQDALLWVERLKRLDPNSFQVLKIEGEIWKAFGNLDECEKSWLSAYHLRPSEVTHTLKLVDLLVEQGRYTEAERLLLNSGRLVRTKEQRRRLLERLEALQKKRGQLPQ